MHTFENSDGSINPAALHQSVLLNECMQAFSEHPLHTFVDGTLGLGGHAEAILKAHPEIQTYVGIDRDPQALAFAKQRLNFRSNVLSLHHSDFTQIDVILKQLNINKVDGMLLDLGVSSLQLDRPEKGFSFSLDGPLDMRMNPEDSLSAAEVINTFSEAELGTIFREYGEEKQWRRAAQVIVKAREKEPIQTTRQLAEVLRPALPTWKSKKTINPLTLIFQGLRIFVNRELEMIEIVLPKALELLAPNGRIAVISFHSLEDRIVKNALRFAASDRYDTPGLRDVIVKKDQTVKLVNRKPIVPSDSEIKMNPRSRSAKLRIAEKL